MTEVRFAGARWYANGIYHRDTVAAESVKTKGLNRIHLGDVTYNRMWATKASFGVVHEEADGCLVTNDFPIFSVDKSVALTTYVELTFHLSDFQSQASKAATGTTERRRLKERDFLGLPVNLPPLEEQQRIVDLIGSLDEAIEAADEAVETATTVAVELRRQLINLPEANANFQDTATLQRGFDLPVGQRIEGSFPVVASGGPVGSHTEEKVFGPGVVTGRSGTIGVVQYIDESFWPLNTTLYVKDFKGNVPSYVRYLLESMDLQHHAGGSTVPSLNRNVLDMVRVYVPGVKQQQTIATTLDTAWASSSAATTYAASLRTLRSELLTVLLSGEHEIPESYDAFLTSTSQLEPAA